MRRILLIVLIIILLLVGYLVSFRGLNILGISVLPVKSIQDSSNQLDADLEKVSTLTSVDQPKAMKNLDDSVKEYRKSLDNYNDQVLYSSTEDIAKANQGVQYEVETLWVKIGNHATKNGVILKLEFTSAGQGSLYNLKFTVTGSYVSISEFIASLENDSSLNFRIEDFKLVPTTNSTENLQGTFTVRELNINVGNVRSSTPTTTTPSTSADTSSTTTGTSAAGDTSSAQTSTTPSGGASAE